MRSVSVVLPESMCAEIPMFLTRCKSPEDSWLSAAGSDRRAVVVDRKRVAIRPDVSVEVADVDVDVRHRATDARSPTACSWPTAKRSAAASAIRPPCSLVCMEAANFFACLTHVPSIEAVSLP